MYKFFEKITEDGIVQRKWPVIQGKVHYEWFNYFLEAHQIYVRMSVCQFLFRYNHTFSFPIHVLEQFCVKFHVSSVCVYICVYAYISAKLFINIQETKLITGKWFSLWVDDVGLHGVYKSPLMLLSTVLLR